jgi:hypothetical protein
VDDDGEELHDCLFGVFEVLAEVEFVGVWDVLSYFAHGVGEAFELEGGDLGDGVEEEAFAGVGAYLAVLAKVLVAALEFVDCEEAGQAFLQRVGPLALLPLSARHTMLKS